MPAGPSWKGYLKLSLVTCPVAMTPATSEGEKIRFHTLNRATGNRVRSRYVDSVTGKEVAEDDEVKAYDAGEDRQVLIEDEEIAAAAIESERTIDIESFVADDAVDWIWYDKPYYLAPDDKVGEEAFAVIRDAMAAAGVVGISRLVIAGRERAVLLQPWDRGILLWTLRHGGELRDAADYFAGVSGEKADAKLAGMIRDLIGQRTREWGEDLVSDPVQENLAKLIENRRKKTGKPKAGKAAKAEPPSNVVSIMEALKRSLAKEKKGKD